MTWPKPRPGGWGQGKAFKLSTLESLVSAVRVVKLVASGMAGNARCSVAQSPILSATFFSKSKIQNTKKNANLRAGSTAGTTGNKIRRKETKETSR